MKTSIAAFVAGITVLACTPAPAAEVADIPELRALVNKNCAEGCAVLSPADFEKLVKSAIEYGYKAGIEAASQSCKKSTWKDHT
jgi:predicted outer membrane protein